MYQHYSFYVMITSFYRVLFWLGSLLKNCVNNFSAHVNRKAKPFAQIIFHTDDQY